MMALHPKSHGSNAIVDLVLCRLGTSIMLTLQMFAMFFILIFYFDQIV